MNWIEQKIIKLEKMISHVYCKVKNLTNIHNELDGLQGGQEGEYYHLTEEQYNNIDNIELTDEKVQITENTNFAQIGQTQKDFNRNVSDYKETVDFKNIEQDERIENLEGINYIWSPTNRTLTLFDRENNQLSQVSLISLDNEGTDLRYNASTLSLELYNSDNELLDSIPVSSFIGSVGTQLRLNSNQLQLRDSQGNILSTVNFAVSNIQGLQNALDNKLNKPTTTSNTTSYPFVVGEDGNGNSARLPAGDLGKNFFNSDLTNTTARNHTMNAGVTVKTLGNPHTLSGLPNKNADITKFRKVRVQNTSGLDAVVDSKVIHNDSIVSMTDAEKLTYRNNLKLSTENYSLSTPRIDFIAPFKLGKDIAGIQYLSCIGSNLLLNLSDCEVKLINTTTNVEYPVSVINTSANTTSQFSFGYNIASLPVGTYRVYVRNMLLTNTVDTTTFEVVSTIVKKNLSALTWQKAVFDGTFTNSTAAGTSVYRQPQSTSGETLGNSQWSVRKIAFLSDVVLNSTEANGNWQIEFSVNYSSQFYTNYSGGSRFGIVDGNVITTPTASADILYGQITSSASPYWRMFPSNKADTASAQTNGKYSIVKTGSIIRTYQIIAGVRIQMATHTITSNFGSLRFLFAANGNSSTAYDMAITVNIENVNI